MKAVDKALDDLLERERVLLAGLTKDERTQLADLLSEIASKLEG
jgi:DNA-binding MarR family transcriptional regulator